MTGGQIRSNKVVHIRRLDDQKIWIALFVDEFNEPTFQIRYIRGVAR
jgi:hypothetical protein